MLPVFVQNIGISLYGWKWHKRRFGGIYQEEYTGFKSRESYTHADWLYYQENKLKEILVHAYKYVPYYNTKFDALGLDIQTLSKFTLDKLHQLPILVKDDLRQFGETTMVSNKREAKGEFYASSGSTGTPTSILFSAPMHQRWSAAFESRIRNWAGLSINNPRGMIGGRRVVPNAHAKSPFYRYNVIEKQVYFSAYHIKPENVPNYVNGICSHKVDYMTGYAVGNYLLAKMIDQLGIQVPQLKAVITSSEKLTVEMRSLFEKVYGCKTYDSYSGVEACGLISECEHGSMHISPDVGIIEIIKEDGNHAKPGESGEVICTGFLNFDQPLVRYRIGDVLTLANNQACKCGRNMPIVSDIVGRTEDVVIGPDGRAMVRFHGIFVNLPDVIEGQIIQHDAHQFEIKVVSTLANISQESIHQINKRMYSQLGEIKLVINQVESIPRNPNGKFKAVISNVQI